MRFYSQINFTQILTLVWNQLRKSFRMVPISPMNSRIFQLKIDFLLFAWAKPWVGSPRKFREYSKHILWWIWKFLILIWWVLLTADKSCDRKTVQKCVLRDLNLRRLRRNQISILNSELHSELSQVHIIQPPYPWFIFFICMIIFSESFHYFFCWNNLSHNKRCSILRSILTRYVIRLRKLLHPSHLSCITFLQIWKILNSSFSKTATKRYVKADMDFWCSDWIWLPFPAHAFHQYGGNLPPNPSPTSVTNIHMRS